MTLTMLMLKKKDISYKVRELVTNVKEVFAEEEGPVKNVS